MEIQGNSALPLHFFYMAKLYPAALVVLVEGREALCPENFN
jgi:hypothetical protein